MPSPPRQKISIIAPAYNEQDVIPVFAAAMVAVMAETPDYEYEVICVDDGSRDRTLDMLAALTSADPRFAVVELSRNFGKEAALTAGLAEARGDAVIVIDFDLQDPPSLIPAMIAAWRAGADVVTGKRRKRDTDSFLKRLTAEQFYKVFNRISKPKLPENVGDFRLMSRQVVDAVLQLRENQRFMKGIFAWVGFRTVELEYDRPMRAAGQTKFSFFRLWNFALEGITSFSTLPLRIWFYVGFAGAGLSSLYMIYMVIRVLIFGSEVPGYPSLLVAILFLGSLQLFSIGILGEYLGRTYLESKNRPSYIVRKVYRGSPPPTP